MTDTRTTQPPSEDSGLDRGWDGHVRRQATIGLELSPAERLRWLEETMATMRRWLGRAEQGRPIGDGPRASSSPSGPARC